MSERNLTLTEAFATLDLPAGSSLDVVKKRFRERVKALHPDHVTATPQTLSDLADLVAAMRRLEHALPACLALDVTEHEARRGVTRTLRSAGRSLIVRIPAHTQVDCILPAVGETDTYIQIRIIQSPAEAQPEDFLNDLDQLDEFIHEFSRPSANSRFARWIRNSQSAA